MFKSIFLLATALLLAVTTPNGHAFTQPSTLGSSAATTMPTLRRESTELLASEGGLFGQGNPLKNLFGGGGNQPKIMVDLATKGIKIGALRFLLQIHLVGEQNNPQPQTWLMKEGGEGELDVYFNDGTGMFSIDLNEYQIKITRYGEKPSLQYQIQESVLIHSILDELHKTAFEVDDIEEEKRLLRLNDDNAIESARSNLLARAQ